MLERFSQKAGIKILWQASFLLLSSLGAIILCSFIILTLRTSHSADQVAPLLPSDRFVPTTGNQQSLSPSFTPFPFSTHSPLPTITDTPLPTALLTTITGCLPQDTIIERGLVVNVVDGNTIEVNIGGLEYRVGYLGIDAPELDEHGGIEALAMNQDMVAGKTVTLIKDITNVDEHDRLLRYVLVDEIFVNYELIISGYAIVASFHSVYTCAQAFMTAQWNAMQASVGLWGIIPTTVAQDTTTEQPSQITRHAIINLTSPVKVGATASLSIQTTPNTICNLDYITPSGNTSTAKGLGSTTAGANGLCVWTWTIGSGTKPGTGILNITVDGVAQSVSIEVVK
jgi:endonuclease YncB( thermonuclease family)